MDTPEPSLFSAETDQFPAVTGRGACVLDGMGRKAVGPVCCVMHVKEPRTLIVKEKELAPVFLDSRLEHPAGWICARYKSSVLLLLLLRASMPCKIMILVNKESFT